MPELTNELEDDLPIIAQKAPYPVEVVAGRKYYWCACGRSKKEPFCDGSHKGTTIRPREFEAQDDGLVYFCGCKHTKTPPLCDGSHADID